MCLAKLCCVKAYVDISGRCVTVDVLYFVDCTLYLHSVRLTRVKY